MGSRTNPVVVCVPEIQRSIVSAKARATAIAMRCTVTAYVARLASTERDSRSRGEVLRLSLDCYGPKMTVGNSHTRRPVRLLIATVALALCIPSLGSPASAAPTGSATAPSTTRVANSFPVEAAPGARNAGRLAVVETVSPARGTELGRAFVSSSGKVAIDTAIPVAGMYELRVRVLNGQRTAWQSSPFDVRVLPGGPRVRTSDAGRGLRIVGHARNAQPQGAARAPRSLGFDDDFDLNEDLDDLSVGAAQSTQILNIMGSSISGALSSPLGQFLGEAAGEWGVGLALNLLMSAVFPGSGATTGQALAQISTQLQQIQTQLNTIESTLNSLEAQVTQEYAQINVVATDSLCISLLDQANDYVNTIQLAQDNLQLATTPAWLITNVGPYANSTAGIRAIGNQVFGTGSGTPSFSGGVFTTQLAVTGLANLLSDDGASGSTGLVTACSSALAAELAANQAALQATGTNITPVGVVDNAYFIQLQQIVGYYAGWVAVGQAITAQGGQMIVASLSPEPLSSASQVTSLCNGATASSAPNLITCSGILAQIAQTQASLNSAWNLTGASWGMVTNGVLAADTQVSPATGGLVSPSAVWPVDLGGYGQASGPQPLPPSTGSASGPAAAVVSGGALAPSTNSWLGLTFSPAKSATWDRLLQVANTPPYSGATAPASTACLASSSGALTSCSSGLSVGGAMSAAGLLVDGAAPKNLILFTGETSTWNPLSSAIISDARLFNFIPEEGYVGLQPPIVNTAPTYTVQAFLDTTMVPVQGASVVVGNPSTSVPTLTPASIYPYYSAPSGSSGLTQSWTATLSPSLTSPATGTVIVTCPDQSSQNNPYPAAAPLTFGPILGLASGATGTVGSGQSSFTSGACTQAAASTVPLSGVPLTSNSTFYSPITAAGTNNAQVGGGSLASLAWNNSNLPGFIGANPQQQYVWPVANPTSPGCQVTSFTEGVGGQANATQTCLGLWQEWSAVYNAQTTGPVTITAPPNQGTGQQSGSNLATVLLTNTSGASQTATLTVASTTSGVQVQGLVTPLAGSNVTVGNCSPATSQANVLAPNVSGSTAVTCALVVPSGTSALNVPVNYTSAQSGGLVAAVTGSSIASAVQFNVSNVPGYAQTPPAPITNLGVSASTGTTATLTWQTPASTPPLTGYAVTTTSPAGTPTTTTIPAASVVVAGQNSSATVTLPSAQAGYWQFTVAGQNSAGNGLSATTTSYLGSGPPPAPANLVANENLDGTVTLTWTPITAMPPVSGYTIVATSPNGVPRRPVTVSVPAFTTDALNMTGTWTFSVSATNTSGTGPQATASVPLLGSAPSAPAGLTATVSSSGSVSAAWSASSSAVPPPTSYTLRVFDSGGRLVRSLTIPTSGLLSTITVPDFLALGSNSPTGTWIVAVSARNATGAGPTARSVLQVTPGLVSGIGRTQSIDSELGQVPTLLSDLDATECRAGYLVSSQYGTCDKRVWKPN